MQQHRLIRRALLSVFDKTSIVEFAYALLSHNVELFSTEGTARVLIKEGLSVVKLSEYSGFPEIMEGRIKSLHPKIHGSILGRRGKDDDIMNQHGIIPIDIVVVNLYPFSQVITHKNCSLENIVENIDIGGSTMIRAAAKNYKDVAVVVDISDYHTVINEMENNKGFLSSKTRFNLAIKAFEYIAIYENKIANFFNKLTLTSHEKNDFSSSYFPKILNLNFIKKRDIRYGENNHQKAALYIEEEVRQNSIATAHQLQGKELSYNNIVDADIALECVMEFNEPACVIVKHDNPCSVAIGNSILDAYERAYKADPISAFGGIIAFNRRLSVEVVRTIIFHQFVEVIIAPSITGEACKILEKKQNIRVIIFNQWIKYKSRLNFKKINGGLLVQNHDLDATTKDNIRIVTRLYPTEQEFIDAFFCWKVVKFVKSNAIVFAKKNMTISIGAGQASRIFSIKIAVNKLRDTGLEARGSVMASDAFLPFRDCIEAAAEIGVTCVIQPGGSIHDKDIIDAANEYNIAMIFTNMRHFRH